LPRKRKWFTEAEHGASPEHGEPTKRPKVRPNSKTKVLGVYPSWNVTGTYTAQIKYSKGKRKYLGDNYSTIEEAKKVYAEAEEEIRGPVFQCSTCSEEWNVKGKKLKDGESWNCPHCVKESDKLKSYINPLYLQRPIERVQKIGKSGHRGVNEQNKKVSQEVIEADKGDSHADTRSQNNAQYTLRIQFSIYAVALPILLWGTSEAPGNVQHL